MNCGQPFRVGRGVQGQYPVEKLSINDNDGIIVKFGPLIIAIIAVCLCFYLYKKVNEIQNSKVNTSFEKFIETQNKMNGGFQDAYNKMVEQFNNLSSVVHHKFVPPEIEQNPRDTSNSQQPVEENTTTFSELSTRVSSRENSLLPVSIQGDIQSYLKLDTVEEESHQDESTFKDSRDDTTIISDKDSEASLSLSYKSDSVKSDVKKKRGRKPKNVIGVE